MMDSLWTSEFFQEMRLTGDPYIDGLVADVAATGGDLTIGRLVDGVHDWGGPVDDRFPPAIRQFLEAPVELPSWMDPVTLANMHTAFRRRGPIALSILYLKVIPQFFTNAVFAKAIVTSLAYNPESLLNKIIGLARMLVLFAEEGSLATKPPKGRATLAIQKLRVFHALTRYFFRHEWKISAAKPISQADIAHAQLYLSLGATQGLQALGFDISEQERDALALGWSVTGFLLGVDPRLIPSNYDDAVALNQAFTQRYCTSSLEAKQIVDNLLFILRGRLPLVMRKYVPPLVRFFIGDALADDLAVPPADWQGTSVRFYGQIVDTMASPLMYWLTRTATLERAFGDEEEEAFSIPDDVAKEWDFEERTKTMDQFVDVQFKDIHGVQTAYRLLGSGQPTIVFIHGWSLCFDYWQEQIKYFSAKCRVLAYDWRGMGISGGAESTYQFPQLVEDLRSLLAALDIDQPILCGHSTGGAIAIQYALTYPDAISALVLADTPTHRSVLINPMACKVLQTALDPPKLLAPEHPLRKLASSYQHLFYSDAFQQAHPEAIQAWHDQFVQNSAVALSNSIQTLTHRDDPTEQLSKIKAKTLVIVGSKDRVISPRQVANYVDKIPGAQQHVIEGAGHLSMQEQPEAFNQAIDAFLGSGTTLP